MADSRPRIVVCAGTACQASASSDIIRVAKRYLLEKQLLDKIKLRITGCHGFCEAGPFILTEPMKAFYHRVGLADVPRIIETTLEGKLVEELLYADAVTGERYRCQDDIPFFKFQQRTIFGRNQKVDPMRIYDYLATGGYKALEKTLLAMTPREVIEEVKASGLRGRGGAGFPTGRKWELLAGQPGDRGKYLVCNADEGDPGAYMDRSLLEGSPHSIIEGMLIGAYATGATHGVVYVRNEYPLAIKHLIIALRQARDLGLLGESILGSKFSFDIEIVKGAGAFVCGEETALMRSVEGKIGEPRQRPPFPVEKGINGRPTAINNVETWANVPIIIERGAAEYAKIGTRGNSGTKVFSLVGKIRNTGLVEVPMGMPIRDIVHKIGGGPSGKAAIKAVQTGGPSGGCVPYWKFDLPIDYDSLSEAGTMMGSGGMIVMDENTCMVDVAKYFMNFLKDESCGKCFTCRKGTQRMHEILDDISKGKALMEQLDLLGELAYVVKDTTMCGLGQTASNPALSTIRYFRREYQRHIFDKRCDAFVCKELVGAPCQSACPIGTEAWRYTAHLAKGEYQLAYNVIREQNPFPSVCARVCDHKCESRCKLGTTGSRPLAIRALKRFITERIDPMSYKPQRQRHEGPPERVAVVGSGPGGLTAAHYLSLMGYHVTVYEADAEPGGMLVAGVPKYRLPRDVVRKEIEALIDDNITVKCNSALGRDITIDGLFAEGNKAVFLALGAHRSRRLGIEQEDAKGCYPAMPFLRAFNLKGEKLAKGRVGVIGGGNSAIDAARVALRQEGVESVTILYRRSRQEMPAFPAEIEAALQEGVKLEELVTPTKVQVKDGQVCGVTFIRNRLGEVDQSGRRSFVPIPDSERGVTLDTLIVAIGEQILEFNPAGSEGLEYSKQGTLIADPDTLATARPGVFAGGDVITGPNTVVDAIAAGKKAAVMIHRFLRGEELRQPAERNVPRVYVEPRMLSPDEQEEARRAEPPLLSLRDRRSGFDEVEKALTQEAAAREAQRCLRCDLEFTQPKAAARPAAPGGDPSTRSQVPASA
ncbi:MAG: FAD-dependent oxidoreductase [Deltaproteobacteria bacterium]|nr:FAD-dependent oxidoreductase [Deltaproteobacteria bacterium]